MRIIDPGFVCRVADLLQNGGFTRISSTDNEDAKVGTLSPKFNNIVHDLVRSFGFA